MEHYEPPFSITNRMLSLVADISEKLGRIAAYRSLDAKPQLRRNNRIRSVHSSLKIEASSLTEGMVRAVLNNRPVIGPEKEIQEVKNAFASYDRIGTVDPYSLKDLKELHGIMTYLTVEESGVFRRGAEGVFDGDRCIFMAPPPEMPEDVARQTAWVEENKTLAPTERDLLYFLLTNGCEELDFESDSEYYCGSEEKATVADFIRSAFDGDGSRMANSAYADTYDAYFALYDEGYSQAEIITRLLNSQDRKVAEVVAQLSTEKYQLTVESFENSLTTTSSWLVTNVPKAVMLYAERRLQDRINGIKAMLKGASPEQELALMKDLMRYQTAQRRIKQRTGREKIK